MNNWQPIETYDNLKRKPKYAVFYVKAKKERELMLPELFVINRNFSIYRDITHWMELTPPSQ